MKQWLILSWSNWFTSFPINKKVQQVNIFIVNNGRLMSDVSQFFLIKTNKTKLQKWNDEERNNLNLKSLPLHICIIILVIIKNKTTSPENKCFTRRSGLRFSEAGSVASWTLLLSALIKRKYLLSGRNIFAIQYISSPCLHTGSPLTPQ